MAGILYPPGCTYVPLGPGKGGERARGWSTRYLSALRPETCCPESSLSTGPQEVPVPG